MGIRELVGKIFNSGGESSDSQASSNTPSFLKSKISTPTHSLIDNDEPAGWGHQLLKNPSEYIEPFIITSEQKVKIQKETGIEQLQKFKQFSKQQILRLFPKELISSDQLISVPVILLSGECKDRSNFHQVPPECRYLESWTSKNSYEFKLSDKGTLGNHLDYCTRIDQALIEDKKPLNQIYLIADFFNQLYKAISDKIEAFKALSELDAFAMNDVLAQLQSKFKPQLDQAITVIKKQNALLVELEEIKLPSQFLTEDQKVPKTPAFTLDGKLHSQSERIPYKGRTATVKDFYIDSESKKIIDDYRTNFKNLKKSIYESTKDNIQQIKGSIIDFKNKIAALQNSKTRDINYCKARQDNFITQLGLDINNRDHLAYWDSKNNRCFHGFGGKKIILNNEVFRVPTRIHAMMNLLQYDFKDVNQLLIAINKTRSERPSLLSNPFSFFTRNEKTNNLYTAGNIENVDLSSEIKPTLELKMS